MKVKQIKRNKKKITLTVLIIAVMSLGGFFLYKSGRIQQSDTSETEQIPSTDSTPPKSRSIASTQQPQENKKSISPFLQQLQKKKEKSEEN